MVSTIVEQSPVAASPKVAPSALPARQKSTRASSAGEAKGLPAPLAATTTEPGQSSGETAVVASGGSIGSVGAQTSTTDGALAVGGKPAQTNEVAIASKVVLPSSDAQYLQNPKPAYPAMSKRLGEQGQVIHNVLIGVDGRPASAKLVKSSGFDRLDQAAMQAVMAWRYVPGTRDGVPVAMSFNVPINWVLE